jgi:hypothetical protein
VRSTSEVNPSAGRQVQELLLNENITRENKTTATLMDTEDEGAGSHQNTRCFEETMAELQAAMKSSAKEDDDIDENQHHQIPTDTRLPDNHETQEFAADTDKPQADQDDSAMQSEGTQDTNTRTQETDSSFHSTMSVDGNANMQPRRPSILRERRIFPFGAAL